MNQKIPSSALSLANITVTYGKKTILHNITADIQQGSFVAIVGPNGAGKTTLINTIVGLTQPIFGSIKLFGEPINHKKHLIAYIPQRMSVDWDFPATVYDVVLMGTYGRLGWLRRPGKKEFAQTEAALDAVGLTLLKNDPIGSLSGGQQQRVFIARALVQDCPVYIMDEPFSGIDQHAQDIIVTILQKLQEEGKTIIVVHHDLQTVADHFDHVLLLNKYCIAYGKTETILMQNYLYQAYGNKPFISFKQKQELC